MRFRVKIIKKILHLFTEKKSKTDVSFCYVSSTWINEPKDFLSKSNVDK